MDTTPQMSFLINFKEGEIKIHILIGYKYISEENRNAKNLTFARKATHYIQLFGFSTEVYNGAPLFVYFRLCKQMRFLYLYVIK